jgi:biotin synthase
MGEDRPVRYRLLQQLSCLDPHPESVPINLLVRVDGTPLANLPAEDPIELVRTIATARILMPLSIVRLSAGRLSLTDEAQALCFLAGANSVFLGDRLLTTPNPGTPHDERLLDRLGMRLSAGIQTVPGHESEVAVDPIVSGPDDGLIRPAAVAANAGG